MESLSLPRNVLLISVIVLVGILANSLTHGRHLRKTLTQVDALDNFDAPAPALGGEDKDDDDDDNNDKKIATEEEEAKEISTSLSSLKLSKIPHRIYVAGNEIVEGFNEKLTKNHVDMKFTYELVEPNLCKMFNPPFGCCWDNRTVALGPNGEGCPVCKNKKKSCRKWKDQCGSQLVKDVCPETCELCPKPKDTQCKDHPSQKDYCPLFARFGLCKRDRIRSYCKQSCNACPSSKSS